MTTPSWHWTKQPNSVEILSRISKHLKGRAPNSGSFKPGQPNPLKGKKMPKEWAEKARLGRLGKMWAWNKGKKCPNSGNNKGRKRSIETRKRVSEGRKGIKPWNIGRGIGTPLGTAIRRHDKYVQWRGEVFTRDNYTCVLCGVKGKVVHADHIVPFAYICKLNNVTSLVEALACKKLWDINNGRTLCVPCHRSTDTYAGKHQTSLYKYPRKNVSIIT